MVESQSDRLQPYWPRAARGESPTNEVRPTQNDEWSAWLAKCMGEHPALTLATAAVVGLALGWMVKRK